MGGCRLPVAGLFDSVNEIMKKYLKRVEIPPIPIYSPLYYGPLKTNSQPTTPDPLFIKSIITTFISHELNLFNTKPRLFRFPIDFFIF